MGVNASIFQRYPSGLLGSSTFTNRTFLVKIDENSLVKLRESICSWLDVSIALAMNSPIIVWVTRPMAVSSPASNSTVLSRSRRRRPYRIRYPSPKDSVSLNTRPTPPISRPTSWSRSMSPPESNPSIPAASSASSRASSALSSSGTPLSAFSQAEKISNKDNGNK